MKFGHVDNLDLVDFSLPILNQKTKKILSKVNTNNNINFFFGAPGWSDVKFKGLIYPSKTSSKNFLIEYSKQFNSIEVNATRYGIPKEHILKRWHDSVNDDFRFSMKVPQLITHRKNINDDQARLKLEEFLSAIFLMGTKSGISFAVMANYFSASQINELKKFIDFWPIDMPLAIEFRHTSWFEKESIKLWQEMFHKRNIIPVITDTPGRRDVVHFYLTNNHLFIRYVGDFSHQSDLERIKSWIEKVRELVQLGVNNIWFYVHQPGDNRERILLFFNHLIPKINSALQINIPLLNDYSNQH